MTDLPEEVKQIIRAANAEIVRLKGELATARAQVQAAAAHAIRDDEPRDPATAALIERAYEGLMAEAARVMDAHHHQHKGKGPGGGQFTSQADGGGGGSAADARGPHGKHHAKDRREKARRKRKPAGKAGEPRREKAKPTRGPMAEARREGKGKDARLVMADGTPAPGHVKASMVPPQWTDVKVSTDPKAEVLVTARDPKGRPKMVLSQSYEARSAAIKFNRVTELIDKHDAVSREIQAARGKDATREEADCAYLMQVQATRPGSNTDTKARVKAYGATTLEARHVVQSGDGVRLQFVGKEGVWHDHLVRDPDLAKMLVARKEAAGSDEGKLFRTSDAKVRDFVAGLDGGKFSPKDFRTSAATRLARDAVAADPERSRSQKEHAIRVKAVAERVSRLLGNRPAQALESYIHPAVFESWKPT